MNLTILVLLNLLVIFQVVCGQGDQSLLTRLSSNSYANDETFCRIPKGDLLASVESTATRVLQGVCNPRELNERITTLENQIFEQFNVLKTMVLNIEDKLRDQDENSESQHRKLHRTISSFKNARNGAEAKSQKKGRKEFASQGTSSTAASQDTSSIADQEENSVYDYYDDEEHYRNDNEEEESTPTPRGPEISRYNSTIHIKDGKRVFTYYWSIRDLPYRAKNWGWKRSLRSESFYIFQYGYRMYMRIYPNQNGKNIYIHVGLTKGDYDNALDWPFKLKHKIQVLDHAVPGEDLQSRIWDPTELCSGWNWRKPEGNRDNYECVGLGFAHDTAFSRRYLYNDSLTVKLTVFLD